MPLLTRLKQCFDQQLLRQPEQSQGLEIICGRADAESRHLPRRRAQCDRAYRAWVDDALLQIIGDLA